MPDLDTTQDPQVKDPQLDPQEPKKPDPKFANRLKKLAVQKRKAGRPQGAKDAPDSPRQQAARETRIRLENAERDKALLRQAEADPSLREWSDLPLEAGLPVYDLIDSSIRSFTGLPGLNPDKSCREEWAKSFASVCNHYRFAPLSHPLVSLGFASFVAAAPTIQALRVLKAIEKAIESEGKDSPKVKALIAEATKLGLDLQPPKQESTNA